MIKDTFSTKASSEPIRVNGRRLWQTLMDMAEIGATRSGGSSRLALTDADRAGRDLFIKWCVSAGCEIRIDLMGNIFARRRGRKTDAPAVLMGSHLDTQETGGRFDGVYGVLAALEVIRTLNDSDIETEFPLEAVVWTNEEGARFAPAMMGSAVWAGLQTVESAHARTDAMGCRVDEELRRIGYLGEHDCAAKNVRATLEAHIEQGPVLERAGKQIGVVTGIQGVRWFEITIKGVSCHAGTTPMEARRDPIRALSMFLGDLFTTIERHQPMARLTIGRLSTKPNSYNTVPSEATIGIDVRHPNFSVLIELSHLFEQRLQAACECHHVEGFMRTQLECPPIDFASECIEAVVNASATYGYSMMPMISGAAHDSMYIARVAPTAMIFVPCAEGISHNPAENARPEDLEAGCNVLLGAVLSLS